MTFVLKTYPLFAANFSYPFSPNEFLSFFGKLYFEFLTRFCFNRFGVPLVSNLVCDVFCTICQRFCQTSEPCPNPMVFLLFNGQWREGGGGGGRGMRRGWIYVWTRISSPTRPARIVPFNPCTATNSFTLLEITIGQDKIYGWSAQGLNKGRGTQSLAGNGVGEPVSDERTDTLVH